MEAEINITKLLSDCIVNVCQTYVKFSTNISVSGNLRFSVDESKYFYVNVNERLKTEVLNILKESQTGVDICDCSTHQLLLDQSFGDGQSAPPVLLPVSSEDGQSLHTTNNTQTFPATTHLPHMSDLATSLSLSVQGINTTTQSNMSLDNGLLDAVKQEPTSHASYGRPNADIKPEIVELSDDDDDPSHVPSGSFNQGLPVYSQSVPNTVTSASQANLTDTTSMLRAQAESVYQSLMQQPNLIQNTPGTPTHMNIQQSPSSNQQFMLPNQASIQSPNTPQHMTPGMQTQSPFTPRHFTPRQYTPTRRKTPGSGAKRGGVMGSVRHRTPSSVKKAMAFKRSTPSSSYTPMAGAMSGMSMAVGEQSGGMMQQGLQIGNVQSFGDDKDVIQQGIAGMGDSQGSTPSKKKRDDSSSLAKIAQGINADQESLMIFRCTKCPDKIFQTKSGLNRHKVAHHSGKCFRCEMCGNSFLHKSSMKQHQISIHGINSDDNGF